MKTLLFVLMSFLYVIPQSSWAEIAESSGVQSFLNRAQSGDANDRVIWGGEGERNMVPELLQSFFQDADCSFGNEAPTQLINPYLQEAYRARASEAQGHLVCQTRYGNETSGQKFVMCSHPSVSCTSPMMGGIKKDNVVYMVPDGKPCNGISAREALLNSTQSRYGDFNVTTAQ